MWTVSELSIRFGVSYIVTLLDIEMKANVILKSSLSKQPLELPGRGTHGDEGAIIMTYTTGSTAAHPNALSSLEHSVDTVHDA